MEARLITVISNAQNKQYQFKSEAETLGQLKTDMTAQNINHNGMVFMEGLTRTEILSDESILPKDVNYKGNITNNLVFMLSQPAKKIKSGGRTRSEIMYDIKSLGLQDACKQKYGRNFTQVSSDNLEKLITNSKKKGTKTTTDPKPIVKQQIPTMDPEPEFKCKCGNEDVDIMEDLMVALNQAKTKNVITLGKYDSIVDILNTEEDVYTQDEINNMFAGLKK